MKFKYYIDTHAEGVPPSMEVEYNESLFKRLISFVTGLDPEQLTSNQNEELAELITKFNFKVKGGEE